MEITSPNQVWAADITYIPMAKGALYLVAIMYWSAGAWWPGGFPIPWTPTSVPGTEGGAGQGKSGGLQHRSGEPMHW